MKHFLFFSALLFCAACAKNAAGPVTDTKPGAPNERTHVGNGGDDNALRDNAWFPRAKPIQVCLESEPAFEKEAKQAVDEAFTIWQRYFDEKSLFDPKLHPERAALPARFQLTTRHDWVDCKKAELRIVVGETNDARLSWERLNDFPGQSAFVVPRGYQPATGDGNGDMWVASPSRLKKEWQSAESNQLWLTGHVIHELGHVFGCGHVPDTLMAKDFIDVLEKAIQKLAEGRESYEELAYRALWPDQKRELLACRDCALETKRGYLNTTWEAFGYLFGDEAVVKVSPQYQLSILKKSVAEPMQMHFEANVEGGFDQLVALENLKLEQTSYGDVPIFKVTYRPKDGAPLETVSSYQTSYTYSAVLHRTLEGRVVPMPLKLVRNGKDAALVLTVEDIPEPWLVSSRLGLPRQEVKP